MTGDLLGQSGLRRAGLSETEAESREEAGDHGGLTAPPKLRRGRKLAPPLSEGRGPPAPDPDRQPLEPRPGGLRV